MNAEKRKRLEAAGWMETTIQEFLDLSDADMEYIETKLALGRRLRELRRRSTLHRRPWPLLKTSQSRVAKMEKGDPTVSVDLLLQALFRLGATRGTGAGNMSAWKRAGKDAPSPLQATAAHGKASGWRSAGWLRM